jgi:transposase
MTSCFMGVDASKGYADFVVLDQSKKVVEENFQLDDTFAGHSSLYKFLDEFFSTYPDTEFFVGIESTGGYENNWYATIQKYRLKWPIHLVRLNPFGVRHHGQASLKRVITDKVSAQTIASYLIAHQGELRYDEGVSFSSARRQWQFMTCLTKQKTQLLNQLNSLLYSANPELLSYCRDHMPLWVRKVLLRFPTARSLSRAKVSSLAKIPYVTREKAEELITSAKKSVASSSDETMSDLIRDVIKQIQIKEDESLRQLRKLRQSCQIPEIDLLTTVPGIGELSALGLYLEMGPVERFPSSKQLASFFGLHPVYKISGDGVSGIRMSKQGRRRARAILYMVMITAISKDDHLGNIYVGLLQRGMEPKAAQGVIMHKICRIIYGMLKNKQAYNPSIDQAYRTRMKLNHAGSCSTKTRRYQRMDEQAPISRRQHKKRKEQEASHAGSSQPVRDQVPAQKPSTKKGVRVSIRENPAILVC